MFQLLVFRVFPTLHNPEFHEILAESGPCGARSWRRPILRNHFLIRIVATCLHIVFGGSRRLNSAATVYLSSDSDMEVQPGQLPKYSILNFWGGEFPFAPLFGAGP